MYNAFLRTVLLLLLLFAEGSKRGSRRGVQALSTPIIYIVLSMEESLCSFIREQPFISLLSLQCSLKDI